MNEWVFDRCPEKPGYYQVAFECLSPDENGVYYDDEPQTGVCRWDGRKWHKSLSSDGDTGSLWFAPNGFCNDQGDICEDDIIYAWADVMRKDIPAVRKCDGILVHPEKYHLTKAKLEALLKDYAQKYKDERQGGKT